MTIHFNNPPIFPVLGSSASSAFTAPPALLPLLEQTAMEIDDGIAKPFLACAAAASPSVAQQECLLDLEDSSAGKMIALILESLTGKDNEELEDFSGARASVPDEITTEFEGLYSTTIPVDPNLDRTLFQSLSGWDGLFNYQKALIHKLWDAYQSNQGFAILDDMGLGKTRQVATFLEFIVTNQKSRGPLLIVCPKSVIHTWEKELTVGKVFPSMFQEMADGLNESSQAIYKFLQEVNLVTGDGFVNREKLDELSLKSELKTQLKIAYGENYVGIKKILRKYSSTPLNNYVVIVWHKISYKKRHEQSLGKKVSPLTNKLHHTITITTFGTLKEALSPDSPPCDLQRYAGILSKQAFVGGIVRYNIDIKLAEQVSESIWKQLQTDQMINENGSFLINLKDETSVTLAEKINSSIRNVLELYPTLKSLNSEPFSNLVASKLLNHKLVFGGIILDEGQIAENENSAITQTVLHLAEKVEKSKGLRFSLSGTPLQNSFQDLWVLHKFLNPTALTNKKAFIAHITSLTQNGLGLIFSLVNARASLEQKEDLVDALQLQSPREVRLDRSYLDAEGNALNELLKIHDELNRIAERFRLRSIRRKKSDPEIAAELQTSVTGVRLPNKVYNPVLRWDFSEKQKFLVETLCKTQKASQKLSKKGSLSNFPNIMDRWEGGRVKPASSASAAAAAAPSAAAAATTEQSATSYFKVIRSWEKIMNHPLLVSHDVQVMSESDWEEHFLRLIKKEYNNDIDRCIQDSGRLATLFTELDKRLPLKLYEGLSGVTEVESNKPLSHANKALVICTSIPMSFLIQTLVKLRYKQAKADIYYGDSSLTKRDAIIQSFNSPSQEPHIVVLSQKAGGSGINLYAHDVYQFNIHWNPASNDQALCRAWRTGNPFENVNITQFLSTSEETFDHHILRTTKAKIEWINFMVDRNPETLNPLWLINFFKNRFLELIKNPKSKDHLTATCEGLEALLQHKQPLIDGVNKKRAAPAELSVAPPSPTEDLCPLVLDEEDKHLHISKKQRSEGSSSSSRASTPHTSTASTPPSYSRGNDSAAAAAQPSTPQRRPSSSFSFAAADRASPFSHTSTTPYSQHSLSPFTLPPSPYNAATSKPYFTTGTPRTPTTLNRYQFAASSVPPSPTASSPTERGAVAAAAAQAVLNRGQKVSKGSAKARILNKLKKSK
jgi:SNF2 family DNA or RNA helicase